ncbi:MAG: hypothetical protein J6M23_05520 [Bacteroidales bacterium]|nr:hypothetical protein [Bacteroidales bacterium]
MKKLIPFILAFLPLVVSCKLEDTYTQTNVHEMVTVKEGVLLNDNGYVLNVKEDALGTDKWKIEGNRYLALFDILNRALDIRLKEVVKASIVYPAEYDETEEYPADPLSPEMAGISGGYLNLGFTYYKAKGSHAAHPIRIYDEVKGTVHYLHISHEGNGEDPTRMDEKDLETDSAIFSLPIETGNNDRFALVMNIIVTDSAGKKTVEEKTINLY